MIEAPKAQTVARQSTGGIICFNCLGVGHVAANCPNKRAMTIVELQDDQEAEEEIEAEEGFEEEVEPETELYENRGDDEDEVDQDFQNSLYMMGVSRILNAQPMPEDPEVQRTNIFRFRDRQGNTSLFPTKPRN